MFSFPLVKGLFFISHALDSSEQVQHCQKCLTEYCTAPNITNLSKTPLQDVDHRKLCWSTVGLHFDWDTRKYRHVVPPAPAGSRNMSTTMQNDRDVAPEAYLESSFPEELQRLGHVCASVAGYEMRGEAAIVNYYKSDKSTMGGHVDDSEDAIDSPLVSISLGDSALFLITPSRQTTPLALMLHSGDILVMGGESRTCVHGVPRIFKHTFPSSLDSAQQQESIFGDCNSFASSSSVATREDFPLSVEVENGSEKGSQAMAEYMQGRRINISIRQVHSTFS